MKTVLNCLCIHLWEYKFSTKLDSNYRECKLSGKQQISGYGGFIDINYQIL